VVAKKGRQSASSKGYRKTPVMLWMMCLLCSLGDKGFYFRYYRQWLMMTDQRGLQVVALFVQSLMV
jgi:hypothetical protein